MMKRKNKKRHYMGFVLFVIMIFVFSLIGLLYKKHNQCQHMERMIAAEQQEQTPDGFVWEESPQGRYLAFYKNETLSTYSSDLHIYDKRDCAWHSVVLENSGYRYFDGWSPDDSYLVYHWTPVGSSGCHGMGVLTGDGREEVFIDGGCRQNLQSAYQPQRWLDDHRLLGELDSFCPNAGCLAIINLATGEIDEDITEQAFNSD